MDFLPGTDVSVRVMFEGLGQPKVPDTGTVSWTLRGDAGDIVLVDQPLSPGPASSSVIVTVPAVHNAIVARYEKRTLITKFSSGGIPYTVSMRYRLVPFLNLEIGPENIRKFVGVNPRELPDNEIDLTRAYFDIEASVTQPVLELMLAGTPANASRPTTPSLPRWSSSASRRSSCVWPRPRRMGRLASNASAKPRTSTSSAGMPKICSRQHWTLLSVGILRRKL